jgi:hypothetical protein
VLRQCWGLYSCLSTFSTRSQNFETFLHYLWKEVSDNADNNADNHMGDISADECRNDHTRCSELAYVYLKDYDNQKGTRLKKFLGKFSRLLKLLTREVNDMSYMIWGFLITLTILISILTYDEMKENK